MTQRFDTKSMTGMHIVSSRLFDWPRETVFDAFSNPEVLKLWWGPDGFSNTFHTFDFRPGGEWRFVMHGPDGTNYDNASDFIEIVPPGLISFYHHGPMHAFVMTMDYALDGGKTRLTWTMASESGEENVEMRAFMEKAIQQNFDRLEEALRGADTSDREIVVSRIINAPRELVFQMFTDPAHVNEWWGPNGFTNTTYEMDVRAGGVWRYKMHGPDGTDYPNRIQYCEVVRPERLAYTHDADEGGDPAHAFEGEITFVEMDDRTQVNLHLICRSAAQRRGLAEFGAIEGGNQTLARLDAYTGALMMSNPGQYPENETFVISRVFKADQESVFAALTEAERLGQWWGPTGIKIVSPKMDLRVGGMFHYGMELPDGNVMWGRAVYREIVPCDRLEFINSFSNENGDLERAPFADKWPLEMLNTYLLEKVPGGTRFIVVSKPCNADTEERAVFKNGTASMMQGWSGTFDKLEEYLVTAE